MMIRNLTATGDWTFGSGVANYITDDPGIALNIKTRLLSWIGDCFFDTAAGIDWANRLGTPNQQLLLETDIRRIILQSYGVEGIITLSAVVVNRALTVNYSINTLFSQGYTNTVTQDLSQ